MNGTLPGLLDDPNIDSSTSLPSLNDVHIPPLRNPAPSRNGKAPLPLELIDSNNLSEHDLSTPVFASYDEDHTHKSRSAHSAPVEFASGREIKKPHLAISELVDTPLEGEHGQVQLPSFVSLSVVEKSPTQQQLDLNNEFPNKRPRLEADSDVSSHDVNRLLPRPVKKDDKQVRPLLPAMVTGLHEPPPSAALLPSMDYEGRLTLQRLSTSKMQVKDILYEAQKTSHSRPPEQMLNTPEVTAAELPHLAEREAETTDIDSPSTVASVSALPVLQAPKKDLKVRRTRRKWTQLETDYLLAGVKKHGFGKWKQILNDPEYKFADRTSIDLKDRFRVFAKDYPEGQTEPILDEDLQLDSNETGTDNQSNRSTTANSQAIANKRRKRHPWTKEEDQTLLHGVQKHGFQWTDIHNDADLGLGHRRATDLRDRIRNLYPDGYKHAEARPLRAEMKKAEKAGKKETPAGTLYAPPSQMDTMNFPFPAPVSASGQNAPATLDDVAPRNSGRRQTASGRVPLIASLTRNDESSKKEPAMRPSVPRRSKTIAANMAPDHVGITLPSLALDPAHDTGDWDNTLPPFINWEP